MIERNRERKLEEKPEERLLTTRELAARLQLSTRTVRKLVRQGDLPVRRFGRAMRFCLSDVIEAGKR